MYFSPKILKLFLIPMFSVLVFPVFVFSAFYGETVKSTGDFSISETKTEPTATGVKVEGSIKGLKPSQPWIKVVYGEKANEMAIEATTINNKTPLNSGSTQSFSFEITGLDANKDYYYAYVNGDVLTEAYLSPTKFTTTASATPEKDDTNNDPVADKTSTDKDMGLIPCDGSTSNPCKFKHLLELVDNFLQWIIYLTIPLAAIAFAYIGWLYLKSQGSEEARTNAKHIFMNVVIGILFVLGAWLIVNTILDIFVEPYIRDQLFIRSN